MRNLVHQFLLCSGLLAGLLVFRRWTASVPPPTRALHPEAVAQEWRMFLEYLHRPKGFVGEIGLHPLWLTLGLALGSAVWLRWQSGGATLPNVAREEFRNQS